MAQLKINTMEQEERMRTLLEKYFDAETSLAEETELREYFTVSPHIPADIEYARGIFGYFSRTADQRMTGPHVENAQLSEGLNKKRRSLARRILVIAAPAAAACLLLITGLNFLKGQRSETVYCYDNGEPVTDIETARQYAAGTLGIISANIREPFTYLEPLGEFDKTMEIAKGITGNMIVDNNK